MLVDTEARSPNDKRHGKESTGDTKRVGLSILRSKKTSDEFVMFDDGTCVERNKGRWDEHMESAWSNVSGTHVAIGTVAKTGIQKRRELALG